MVTELMDPCADAVSIRPLSVDEAAQWLSRLGGTIAEFKGNPWRCHQLTKSGLGAWRPVDECSPLSRDAIGRPDKKALAYWAVVTEKAEATSSVPTVIFDDLESYDSSRLRYNRRRSIRLALETFDFTVERSPDRLLDQGWRVASSASALSGAWINADQPSFAASIARRFASEPELVVTGSIDGVLAAFLMGHVIGDTATISLVYIDPRFRRQEVGSGLYWVALRHLARSQGVRRVECGAFYPERPGLDLFKFSMGASLVDLPVRGGMLPPVAWRSKRNSPAQYMRMGGRDPRVRAQIIASFEAAHGPLPFLVAVDRPA
jgi:ribosomal protein S18 acetylase RimI-like enzyme